MRHLHVTVAASRKVNILMCWMQILHHTEPKSYNFLTVQHKQNDGFYISIFTKGEAFLVHTNIKGILSIYYQSFTDISCQYQGLPKSAFYYQSFSRLSFYYQSVNKTLVLNGNYVKRRFCPQERKRQFYPLKRKKTTEAKITRNAQENSR